MYYSNGLSIIIAHSHLVNHQCACMHSEGYCSWVCVSVCLSTPQLTSRWFVCPRNDATHLSDNENQFNFMAYSEGAPLLRYGVICISRQCRRPYLVFVATEASLLVRKANDILITTI